MYRKVVLSLIFASIWYTKPVVAHEMTPTYPKFVPSFMSGLQKVSMKMFNKRKDVEWYEIGVFDESRYPIPFVSSYKVVNIPYLGHADVDVYVRDEDVKRVTYICSRSKLRTDKTQYALVSSIICSKVKR
jgi:hypothetical protein